MLLRWWLHNGGLCGRLLHFHLHGFGQQLFVRHLIQKAVLLLLDDSGWWDYRNDGDDRDDRDNGNDRRNDSHIHITR